MSEPDEGGSRPSPMIYDGGLRISEDGNSFIPVDHRVFITCYSALSRRTRWALAVKHGSVPKKIRCPLCQQRAIVELEQDGDE